MPTTAMPSHRLLKELRGAPSESRLDEMGVLRSFSLPRVSSVNAYSVLVFRPAKNQPDYTSRPPISKEDAC